MTIYTTPLQFAYFFGLLFSILLLIRGFRDERLSDKLLAAVMFLLSMEIQDYTFGFSGINYLWEEMEGFPRHFGLAFAPTIYQINKDLKLTVKDLAHYIPYSLYFAVNLMLFLQGKESMYAWYETDFIQFLSWVEKIATWISYIVYFYYSLKLYYVFRKWTETQFSNIESVSFVWLSNFIYLIIAGEVFKFIWQFADYIIDMPFEKDWWWHLFTVGIIIYVGVKGYTQVQPKKLVFDETSSLEPSNAKVFAIDGIDENALQGSENLYAEWEPKIEKMMKEDKIFLEPELSLSDMAVRLKTNTSVLSAAINKNFGKNFNDFINEYRIQHFKSQCDRPENKHYTKLAIAYDSGFNSRATFNRALKKFSE
jgi:AraC-like DNA-binding protein